MQELHRPLQRNLAGADQCTLAAHAAQVWERIARRQSAAVDDRIFALAALPPHRR